MPPTVAHMLGENLSLFFLAAVPVSFCLSKIKTNFSYFVRENVLVLAPLCGEKLDRGGG